LEFGPLLLEASTFDLTQEIGKFREKFAKALLNEIRAFDKSLAMHYSYIVDMIGGRPHRVIGVAEISGEPR
jgi:hypothetical protein